MSHHDIVTTKTARQPPQSDWKHDRGDPASLDDFCGVPGAGAGRRRKRPPRQRDELHADQRTDPCRASNKPANPNGNGTGGSPRQGFNGCRKSSFMIHTGDISPLSKASAIRTMPTASSRRAQARRRYLSRGEHDFLDEGANVLQGSATERAPRALDGIRFDARRRCIHGLVNRRSIQGRGLGNLGGPEQSEWP